MKLEELRKFDRCAVCDGVDLADCVDLPAFPLTGIFVEDSGQKATRVDQTLMICNQCGHLQLYAIIPPEKLYLDGYAHRSSGSHISRSGAALFIDYVHGLIDGTTPKCAVEIGCNDLFLIEQLSGSVENAIGIDPIWKHAKYGTTDTDNVRVIGKFVEEVDFKAELPTPPDLIFSTHNLEHIADPAALITYLFSVATEDALFVMEVPDSIDMIDNLRFDQVFHQHLHYFTLRSFLTMLERIGGAYVAHTKNHRNWGGPISIAFRRKVGLCSPSPPTPPQLTLELVQTRFDQYRRQMANRKEFLESLRGGICGFGGGQMVPSFAYHLDSDLSFLETIFDDDPGRHGLFYPEISPQIKGLDKDSDLTDQKVLITALDAIHPILKRLEALPTRQIVMPVAAF